MCDVRQRLADGLRAGPDAPPPGIVWRSIQWRSIQPGSAVTEQSSGNPRAPVKVGSLAMWVLGLVVLVDATDQSILRGVQSLIQKEFHVGDATIGFLSSVFVVVLALTTVPAGYLADRLNRRRVIAITIVLWSVITAVTGLAQSFVQIMLIRASLGFGLGITEPSANSLLTDLYPTNQRGRAFSIQQLLQFVGFGVGIGVGGAIGATLGWRWAFALIGLPGVVTAALVLLLREPKRGHGDRLSLGLESSLDDADEKPPLFEHGLRTFVGDMVRGLRDDVKTIAQIPTLRFVLVGIGVLLFAVQGIGFWLPVYHERFSDMSITKATSAVGAVVVVGGVLGTLLGGVIADRLQNRIKGARVAIPAVCIMAGSVLLAFSFAPIGANASLFVQTLAVFVFTLAIPALRAGVGDAVPAELRGAGFAAFALISAMFGAAAAPIIGAISDATNLRVAFLATTPTIFLGAVLLFQARRHLDEDVGKVLMAVQRAYQEQMALEERRYAEEHGEPAPSSD
jgi:MFS transporter, Spinster family, sphingosine-1-phosphate transporter